MRSQSAPAVVAEDPPRLDNPILDTFLDYWNARRGARLMPSRVAEVDERIEIAVSHRENTAALPSVSTVRSTERDELFAAKAHAAVAAVPCDHINGDFINKFHN